MRWEEGFVLTTDGVRLFYRKAGNGVAVVIPNGLYFARDFEWLAETRTMIVYDARNRGMSDPVPPEKLARGILSDVDDLDEVRRHFGFEQIDLIGHSYVGMMVALYAMQFAGHAGRVAMIGAVQPDATASYRPELAYDDGLVARVFGKIAEIQKSSSTTDPVEKCREFWNVLRAIYVADPRDAEKIDWGRCEVANERNALAYLMTYVVPSIQKVTLTAADFEKARAPVLVIHGRKDRSTPYGGGRDWAMRLPDARLLTVENAAHAPWLEDPEVVMPAVRVFFAGNWPGGAEDIKVANAHE